MLGLAAACTAYIDVVQSGSVAGDDSGDPGGSSSTGGDTSGTEGGTDSTAGPSSASEGSTGPAPTCDGACPRSCAEVLAGAPDAVDGEYTLHVDNDPARPWQAWCADMAGTPAEYLILVMTGADRNFSEYVPGTTPGPGTTVRTSYTRIRIDPHDLVVDISDQTFSTSTGELLHFDIVVTSMPYGVAMECIAPFSSSGRGNVDLRGTPFTTWDSQWVPTGDTFAGGATASAGGQVIDLAAGGHCGHIEPRVYSEVEDPFNDWGGFKLYLLYPP